MSKGGSLDPQLDHALDKGSFQSSRLFMREKEATPSLPEPTKGPACPRKSAFKRHPGISPLHCADKMPGYVPRQRACIGLTHPPRKLVGSLEESLFRDRMPAPPKYTIPFCAQLGAIGQGSQGTSRCIPRPISIPFQARVYESPGDPESGSFGLPYAGNVDLTEYYHGRLASVLDSHYRPHGLDLAELPGYAVPETGRIQLVIRTPSNAIAKLLLIPYDMSNMEPGTKTFLRHRIWLDGPVEGLDEDDTAPRATAPGKRLCVSVHLRLCRPPVSPHRRAKPWIYLCDRMDLVFHARQLDSCTRTIVETISPRGAEAWSTCTGPDPEWQHMLRIIHGGARKHASQRKRQPLASTKAIARLLIPIPRSLPLLWSSQYWKVLHVWWQCQRALSQIEPRGAGLLLAVALLRLCGQVDAAILSTMLPEASDVLKRITTRYPLET